MTTPLVSAAELADALPRGDVLVLDGRFDLADAGKGRRDHRDAHVPGAVYVDLDDDLSDLSRQGLGRHPLPDNARLSAALSRAGWRPGRRVVAYDDANGAPRRARGGCCASSAKRTCRCSTAVGRRGERPDCRSRAAMSRPRQAMFPCTSTRRPWSATRSCNGDSPRTTCCSSTRAAPRFRGEVEPIDRVGGHVPGAVNRPFADNLDANGRFKPADALRAEFSALLGAHAPKDVVHMCGSGVTACHNLLAMEHAGLHGSRVFAPSWSGWISDPARPVAKG
jgi:thiosulfate/3-mercaptopyruvate sulfurtransferase